jgi:leucine--tRNA ligase
VENEVQLTVSFNGKARFQMTFPADATKEDIEKNALADDRSKHYIDGKTIVKIIVVPRKIINIVCK